jgi:hypothetical protein
MSRKVTALSILISLLFPLIVLADGKILPHNPDRIFQPMSSAALKDLADVRVGIRSTKFPVIGPVNKFDNRVFEIPSFKDIILRTSDNSPSNVNQSASIFKRWMVPVGVTFGVGLLVYTVYSVRGR